MNGYKSPPRESESALSTILPKPTAREYRAILVDARKRQLSITKDYLERLLKTYDRAAANIIAGIEALPAERQGLAWSSARFSLLQNIDQEIGRLTRDYSDILQAGMVDVAQAAADREARVAKMVGAPADTRLDATQSHHLVLTDGASVDVQFGRLAIGTVDLVAQRVYSDGLTLSDRIYGTGQEIRTAIGDALVQGIQEGISARNLGKLIEPILIKDGVKNPRMRADVIAKTEINNAHRESSIQSAIDPATGNLKDYIESVGWRLSASHKQADICDVYANDDTGLGPGNYLPGDVPVGHARCLCYTASVLVSLPNMQFVTKQPDVASVPRSQLAYYAAREDAPARAALNALGAAD